jgi:hypothetical protein
VTPRCRRRCRRAAIAQVGGDEGLSGGDVQGAKADTAERRKGDLAERPADHSVRRPSGCSGAACPSPGRPIRYSLGIEGNRTAYGHPTRPALWTGRGRRAAVLPPPFTSQNTPLCAATATQAPRSSSEHIGGSARVLVTVPTIQCPGAGASSAAKRRSHAGHVDTASSSETCCGLYLYAAWPPPSW